jgi:hypothetical protein
MFLPSFEDRGPVCAGESRLRKMLIPPGSSLGILGLFTPIVNSKLSLISCLSAKELCSPFAAAPPVKHSNYRNMNSLRSNYGFG